MKENYYTAAEAAKELGLEYHTFMWRVRKKSQYIFERWGAAYVFEKAYIDSIKKTGRGNEDHAPSN